MFLEDFLKEEVYCHFLTPKVVTNYSINDTTRIHIYSNISPPFHTPSLHCRLWLSPFKCLLTGLDYLTSFHLFYLCSNRFWVGNQLPTLLNWISNSHAKARAHSLIWKVVNSLLILNFYSPYYLFIQFVILPLSWVKRCLNRYRLRKPKQMFYRAMSHSQFQQRVVHLML